AAGIPKQTVKHGEPITVRTDHLPGAGELLPDGRVRYVVALGELCQAPKIIETRLEMQPSITVGGATYFVASGAMMAGGAGLIGHGIIREDELGSNKSERAAEISIGVGLLIAGALLTGLGASRAGTQKRKLIASTSLPTQSR